MFQMRMAVILPNEENPEDYYYSDAEILAEGSLKEIQEFKKNRIKSDKYIPARYLFVYTLPIVYWITPQPPKKII